MPVGQAATSQTSSPALIIHQPSFFLPQRYLVLSIVVVLAPNMGPIGPGGNHLRKKAPASPLVLYSRVEIVPTGVLHIKLEWLVEYSKCMLLQSYVNSPLLEPFHILKMVGESWTPSSPCQKFKPEGALSNH